MYALVKVMKIIARNEFITVVRMERKIKERKERKDIKSPHPQKVCSCENDKINSIKIHKK